MGKTLYGTLVWFLASLFVVYAFCLNTAAVVFSDAIKLSLNLSSIEGTVAVGAFIAGFAGFAGFALMQIALLMGIYLPHYNIGSLIIIKIVSFFIGFFLSGSMLVYTVVSEQSSDSFRGVALSMINTAFFLTNTLMMFIPLIFITNISHQFFTYLWVLPFFTLFSILLLYFINDTFSLNQGGNNE